MYILKQLKHFTQSIQEYKKSFIKYAPFVGGFSILFFTIFMIIIFPKSEEKRTLKYKTWENTLKNLGYESIYLITDNDWNVLYNAHGNGWGSLKRIYINGKIVNVDSLQSKEEFFFNHCDKFYYLYNDRGRDGGSDSIVYRFVPNILYEIYSLSGERMYISNRFYQKKRKMNKYKSELPNCN